MNTETFTSQKPLNSLVLFLIFNRPDTTKQVFEAIRKAQPKRFFIAADGPQRDKPGEAERCAEVRRIVDDGIDWDCRVHRLYRDENLGCKVAVSSAIDWFFEHVDEGIILEDDCLPNQSFFKFCQELLTKYRNDERIMHISGYSLQNGIKRGDGSYYFSKYDHVWGWATWKRAWQHYDIDMRSFPRFKTNGVIKELFDNKREQKCWQRIFQRAYEGRINAWSYPWIYAIWTQNGLSIVPNINMVSNIGFRNDATHTVNSNDRCANIPVFELDEIIPPSFAIINKKADQFTFNSVFKNILIRRVIRKIRKILNRIFVLF